MRTLLSALAVGLVAIAAPSTQGAAVFAQEQHAQHDATPLDRDIGTVTMQISCAEPARRPFLRGLALLHSFAWEDARRQFKAAATADAACAIVYWGEAMTYYDGLRSRRRRTKTAFICSNRWTAPSRDSECTASA